MFFVLCVIGVLLCGGLYYKSQLNNKKHETVYEDEPYTVFDDIMTDTIGYLDGIYKFKNDNSKLIFICTDGWQLEKKKHIFIYDKKAKSFKINDINYFSWVSIATNAKDKEFIESLNNIELHKEFHLDKKYKKLLNRAFKYNDACRSSVIRIKKRIKNAKRNLVNE